MFAFIDHRSFNMPPEGTRHVPLLPQDLLKVIKTWMKSSFGRVLQFSPYGLVLDVQVWVRKGPEFGRSKVEVFFVEFLYFLCHMNRSIILSPHTIIVGVVSLQPGQNPYTAGHYDKLWFPHFFLRLEKREKNLFFFSIRCHNSEYHDLGCVLGPKMPSTSEHDLAMA